MDEEKIWYEYFFVYGLDGKPAAVFRWRHKGEHKYPETWNGIKWELYPPFYAQTGIGGDHDYEETTEQEALDFVKSHSWEIEWSPWYRLDDSVAKKNIPDKPGIYEIKTEYKFGRLRGESDILSIGKATPSLRNRLGKGRLANLVRNLDRPEKWLFNSKHMIWFRYLVTHSVKEAEWLEAIRQWEYENKHWELPPGNDRLEKAAIFRKIEEQYGPLNQMALMALLKKHESTEKVAHILGVPRVVVENLKVYWMMDDLMAIWADY